MGKARGGVNLLADTASCAGKINYPTTGEVPRLHRKHLVS